MVGDMALAVALAVALIRFIVSPGHRASVEKLLVGLVASATGAMLLQYRQCPHSHHHVSGLICELVAGEG